MSQTKIGHSSSLTKCNKIGNQECNQEQLKKIASISISRQLSSEDPQKAVPLLQEVTFKLKATVPSTSTRGTQGDCSDMGLQGEVLCDSDTAMVAHAPRHGQLFAQLSALGIEGPDLVHAIAALISPSKDVYFSVGHRQTTAFLKTQEPRRVIFLTQLLKLQLPVLLLNTIYQ